MCPVHTLFTIWFEVYDRCRRLPEMLKRSLPGRDLEYAVMRFLWDNGPSTPREVYERLGRAAGLVYTTIAKVLDRLVDKDLVARGPAERSFKYRCRVRRQTVDRARVSELLAPEPRAAFAGIVDALEAVDPRLLDELARVVAARRKQRRGP